MDGHPPGDLPAAGRAAGTVAPAASAAGIRPGRRLIAVMLLAAAALDLTRCGIVLVTARPALPAAGLVAAGLAAAALSLCTARGCQGGRRWSGWAAVLIGAASAPQAAASGFHAPYTIPNTATAALGVLLTVAVLATAGQTRPPGQFTEDSCPIGGAFGDVGCYGTLSLKDGRQRRSPLSSGPAHSCPRRWRHRRWRKRYSLFAR